MKRKGPALLPAVFLLVIWPCFVHMDMAPTRLEGMAWFPQISEQGDFFMHIRSKSLLVLSVVMLAVMADRILLQRKRIFSFKRDFPLLIYAVMTIVSTCFSEDTAVSMFGLSEQYETCPVLLSYLVIFWYFSMIVRDGAGVRMIAGLAAAGAAVQGMIGLSQTAGFDFWNSGFGKRLILLGNDSGQTLQFQFTEEAGGKIYLSFYNPNYAAVYLLLILPLLAAAVIVCRKFWQKAAAAASGCVLLFCLWGTGSKTAVILLPVLAVIGAFLYCGRCGRKNVFFFVCAVCIAAAVCGGFTLSGKASLESIVKNAFPEKKTYQLQNVTLRNDSVQITYADTVLNLQMQEENGTYWFSISDENGNTYPMDQDEATGRFTLEESVYENLEFDVWRRDGASYIVMYHSEIPWYFVRQSEDEPYQYLTLYGKPDTPEKAEAVFAEGYERAFTSRMYLWQRSIPLLKRSVLIGTGPCTFALVFPQNDYVMRANLGIKMLMEIISRPHSFYLQTAIQTGVLSLVALLAFMGRYLIKVVSYIRKEKEREKRIWGTAVMLSVLAFLLTGFTNDAVVVTAPIFWALLGAGCGLLSE